MIVLREQVLIVIFFPVSFGGIAGLFLGFSLLSGAELLYWIFAGVAVCVK